MRKKTWCNNADVRSYCDKVEKGTIRAPKEIKQQIALIKKEFSKGKIEVDNVLYKKYIAIGFLFYPEIFPYQKFLTAVCLCTFYKGTKTARWDEVFLEMGRGNGKDGIMAWWSACLTSPYHGVQNYDIDIIANSYDQSYRSVKDIIEMAERMKKEAFYKKKGEYSCLSVKTNSMINARSSDASVQDGLRSGAVMFNEVHEFQNYDKINVMISGLGKIDDARTFYFTTNGKVRGGVLDDMHDTAKDVLTGSSPDNGCLYFIYKLDTKEEVRDKRNWVKANPSAPYRPTLMREIEKQYNKWQRNPDTMPSFFQKRMNLPEMPRDQEVVPWEVILKTNQEIDYSLLEGRSCVLGLDMSRTTDWTGVNLLFYIDEIDKYVCLNHAFVCGKNRDIDGIKAPIYEWAENGMLTIIENKEVEPEIPINWALDLCAENNYYISCVVIDDFRKAILLQTLENKGFSKQLDNLMLVRPSNIAQALPVIERVFMNERFVWGDNPMLRWATNNTKVIPWKKTTTGDNDLGNQLYAKINPRFRKTDPFMALVHSMCKADDLAGESTIDLLNRGF